ncbi:MAG TPA: hypothetical protein VFC78_11035 [Tepidisphaeraceae bacterium]|nr:hypothetical protein [Tepidisphaeraceae bacterium]
MSKKTTKPARASKQKKQAEPAKPSTQIWRVLKGSPDDTPQYLITSATRANDLIAFVNVGRILFADEALALAQRVAADPDEAGKSIRCIDLRPYGKADSTAEMPSYVYGLICQPLDQAAHIFEPWPFCRFRMEKMLLFHALALAEAGKAFPCAFMYTDASTQPFEFFERMMAEKKA